MSVKVIQEQLPDSQVGLEIEISADLSKKSYEQSLAEMMRSVSIPGFRKGKVPRQVFLQRMGSAQVKAATLEKLVETALDTAIKQEEIQAIGNYTLTTPFEELLTQFTPGEALTLKAAVDVPPTVVLETYTGLVSQAEEVPFDPGQVDEVLEDYRQKRATLVPVDDRPAQEGDKAIIDFLGQIRREDGSLEPFEGGQGTDFELDLNPDNFIPGFVSGIVGMALEETKDVEATFPESYGNEDLAGKPAVFTITLKELKEKELPELDDDFAEEVSDFDTLEGLKAHLTEEFQKEAAEKTKENQRAALLKVLVEQMTVALPKTLIDREVTYLVYQTLSRFAQQGLNINSLTGDEQLLRVMRENARPEAIERLKRTLALGKVAEQESLKLEEEAITARLQELMEDVADPSKVDQDRLREVVTEEMLQELILDWLLEHNTIELVPPGTLSSAEEAKEAKDDEDDEEEGDKEGELDDAVEAIAVEVVDEEA